MRICIFSDVHGNLEALKLMLKKEKNNTDVFIFLGDIFGYFHGQKEIMNILMDIPNMYSVKGNHDDLYTKGLYDSELRKKCVDTYGKSYELCIDRLQQEFIKKMPEYLNVNIAGKEIGIYHGGPSDYLNERIYPDSQLTLNENEKFDYLFLGHTHYRLKRAVGKTLVINPGSLGQPRDGMGFSYCILHPETNLVEFKNVEIDVNKLLQQTKIIDNGTNNYRYLEKKYGVQNE